MIELAEDRIMFEPMSECWLWVGWTTTGGYGGIRTYKDGKHTNHATHRVSYEQHIGPVPDGLHVRHKCDTPCCVNPDHLEVGTHQDNMDDKKARGRTGGWAKGYKGEMNVNSKLDAAKVREIRRIYAAKEMNQYELASFFDVSHPVVSKVIRRTTWSHVD